MKRYAWFLLVLPLALGLAPKVAELGAGPAYDPLAKIPVMHAGRKKPLDTVAREEIKQIFGRETIKFRNDKDEVVSTWGPVAAMFDWTVRPEFWDDQPFILAEYLPLKRLILGDAIEARLSAIEGRTGTSAADRAQAKALLSNKDLEAADLARLAKGQSLTEDDRKGLNELAHQLGEAHKWLSPRQLQSAQIKVDGQKVPFEDWFRDAAQRKTKGESGSDYGAGGLTDVEKRGIEVGTRLVHYQAFRDLSLRSVETILVMPRPSNAAYLAFCGATMQKLREAKGPDLTPLEEDTAKILLTYFKNIPAEDWKKPGEDSEFDASFRAWLKDGSVWVPLKVILDSKPEELAKAGFPDKETTAFLDSYRALQKAEEASPGKVPASLAATVLNSARAMGNEVQAGGYPTADAMSLETHFNETNPFFRAPYGYFLALAFLAVSLGFTSAARGTFSWKLGTGFYWAGMFGLLAGIGLEVLGFSMRVRISGWAPVTNMYETVIWVSLVAAVLALVFELIFRKTFAALAGSGVALLGTVLAANVPLLDPGIHTLQPVLRSNYWLTIHVLTEVSSYAAFALAWALGMIATLYYLTATYRRSPSYIELGAPLVPGLPLLVAGWLGLAASYGGFGVELTEDRANLVYYISAALAAVGGTLTIVGGGAVLGELIARSLFREEAQLDSAAIAGEASAAFPAATAVQTVTVGEEGGAVATLTKPTVAEIRARSAQSRPKLDARGLAMQATAARIKPLSNFIYRTMQVGVLLIAAGTILGGWWADYSWGRFWGWDPKEVWALITLLVYLIPLHGRFAGWVNTFGLVMSSVVCFLSVIMAWYGVNFVLGVGLHSYGFVEGGSQGVVGAVILAVLAVAGAAVWRRRLASRIA